MEWFVPKPGTWAFIDVTRVGFSDEFMEQIEKRFVQWRSLRKPPSSPEGWFTQILSVGIGGWALRPQFVAEALAPDNPSLKVLFWWNLLYPFLLLVPFINATLQE
ncbi:unnamed protein product [Lupinus luteus]|uniref:Uncharacterized protein n=1 Tax=Lupinus luteus TaxID=3873 RepID=A0AAV1Y9Q5_LUPLU